MLAQVFGNESFRRTPTLHPRAAVSSLRTMSVNFVTKPQSECQLPTCKSVSAYVRSITEKVRYCIVIVIKKVLIEKALGTFSEKVAKRVRVICGGTRILRVVSRARRPCHLLKLKTTTFRHRDCARRWSVTYTLDHYRETQSEGDERWPRASATDP